MCGIAGIAGPQADGPRARAVLDGMVAALVHRGPDDGRVSRHAGCALGARRLSIVDLAGGRQPMADPGGQVVLAWNGEIYDHLEHRARLAARGVAFRTRSDTETLLALYMEEGASAFARVDGMFAAAVWDGRTRTLHLARDRMGEKPLVWFESEGTLVFASEWRALREHPDAPVEADPDALARYLLHRYVPAPLTAVRGVRRLPPGHLLAWRDGRAVLRPFATVPVPPARGGAPAETADLEGAAREVRARLSRAVAARCVADVPVGVFLSGGVDSAAIAAFARDAGPVRTFTLRPADRDFDEGDAARATAEALGTEHHEIAVSPADLHAGFEEAFERIDEPIGDPSVVPTLLLARGARREVKAVLTGEGGDELFGGYPAYSGLRAAASARALPGPLRRGAAALLRRAGRAHGNVGTAWLLGRLLDGAALPPLERHLAWTGAFGPAEQRTLWRPGARPALVDDGLLDAARDAAAAAGGTGDPLDPILRFDLLSHLPEALLAKVDRATMLVGLEARAPFLARDVVDLAAALPARWKARGLRTKVVLRRALRGVVPAEVLARRKRGFAVPASRLLAGPLGLRLEERLRSSRIARDLLDPAPALALLAEHRTGRADHGRRLYPLLALLEWGERWLRPAGPRRAGRDPNAERSLARP